MILFTLEDLFTKMLYMMGMGEKPRNTKEKTKNKEKIPRLVALPSTRLRNRGRLFSDVRKTPKTRRTYPKWERDPNLMGQKKKTGLGAVRAVESR